MSTCNLRSGHDAAILLIEQRGVRGMQEVIWARQAIQTTGICSKDESQSRCSRRRQARDAKAPDPPGAADGCLVCRTQGHRLCL